jgi:hypothetical protein
MAAIKEWLASDFKRYRTMCMRLCDCFFWPVSYGTRRDRFARDAKQCEISCPSLSRLFVYRNPGAESDDMVDLKGRPYRKLPTAFLYRSKYVANCTCRGNPWEQDALARHRAYAEAAKGSKGKASVKSEKRQAENAETRGKEAQRPDGRPNFVAGMR